MSFHTPWLLGTGEDASDFSAPSLPPPSAATLFPQLVFAAPRPTSATPTSLPKCSRRSEAVFTGAGVELRGGAGPAAPPPATPGALRLLSFSTSRRPPAGPYLMLSGLD